VSPPDVATAVAARPAGRPPLIDQYRLMLLIRAFEERAATLFEQGVIFGTAHSCVGQEAIAVGAAGVMRETDYLVGHHRSHGHLIAAGADLQRMMAEMFGKRTGYCKGLGGSMHIADLSLDILGCNGIVGAGIPHTCGAALTAKLRGTGQVAVAFFGDGATNIGAFHEAANMACALHLPIVFACENNEYGEFTPRSKTMAINDVVERAAGYGMPGVIVDGMDVVAVYEVAAEAVGRARRGEGPSFIEAKTYRFYNHHGIQNLGLKYRSDEEVADWKARDPITILEQQMIDSGSATAADFEEVWSELRADIEAAIEFADASPVPEADQLMADVYTVSDHAAVAS